MLQHYMPLTTYFSDSFPVGLYKQDSIERPKKNVVKICSCFEVSSLQFLNLTQVITLWLCNLLGVLTRCNLKLFLVLSIPVL